MALLYWSHQRLAVALGSVSMRQLLRRFTKRRRGPRLEVSFGNETALIYPWQIVKEPLRQSPAPRLVWFPASTVSKRFFLLGSGKRTQRTAYTVRNHGSESFVAEETVESDALHLASSTKVQSPLKTRFEESDHVRKSEEICGQITQQPPTSRI